MDMAVVESLAVACLLFPVFVAAHVALYRRKHADRGMYADLVPAALVHVALWFAVMLVLGLHSFAQAVAALCLIGFFCLAYGQVFSLTVRGFSLRIIVDVMERGSLDMAQIMAGYSGGRGLDWMMEKRLAGLQAVRLLRRDGDTVVLTPSGHWAGLMGVWTKKLIKIGPGG